MDGSFSIKKVNRTMADAVEFQRLYEIMADVLPGYRGGIAKVWSVSSSKLSSYALLNDEGFVVGGYALFNEDDNTYINFIALTDGMQGKGLGRKLIEHATEETKKLGKSRLRLETQEGNVPKFKRLGFREYVPGSKGDIALYKDL